MKAFRAGNTNNVSENNNTNTNADRVKSVRQNKKTPDNARFPRAKTDKYCWTHGECNHNSNECQRKTNRHHDNATFSNRMSGSNAYCN